jgi:hypothetical protein
MRGEITFGFTGPPHNFSIEVKVKGVSEESVSFQWLLFAVNDNAPFMSTNGFFVVWLKDATLSVGDNPEPSVAISRDPVRLDLTVIRAFASVKRDTESVMLADSWMCS